MNDFLASMKGASQRIVGSVADAGAKTMLKVGSFPLSPGVWFPPDTRPARPAGAVFFFAELTTTTSSPLSLVSCRVVSSLSLSCVCAFNHPSGRRSGSGGVIPCVRVENDNG